MGDTREVTIDWKKVDQLLECGNDGIRVAANIGIHPDTLYRRCKEEHGIGFADYLAQKRSKGVSRLLAKQYEVAMKGNTTMLVWVGKQMAGQKDGETKSEAPYIQLIELQNKMMEMQALLQKNGINYEPQTKPQLPGSDTSV